MNELVYEFYKKSSKGDKKLFTDVIVLNRDDLISWEEIINLCPNFPRGWYELEKIQKEDKIEFVKEFWQATLPYDMLFDSFLSTFFFRIEDIGSVLLKRDGQDNYVCEQFYVIKEKTFFFRGAPPITTEQISRLNNQFSNNLPRDYLSFLKIHNGFGKNTDYGLINTQEIQYVKDNLINPEQKEIKCQGLEIDPKHLIPFYKSYDGRDFQCFFMDWYPSNEMGNVCYSLVENTISDYKLAKLENNLSFTSFLKWLLFYLEEIEM
jgi:hypothetical protein